jgi:hypothetical protein
MLFKGQSAGCGEREIRRAALGLAALVLGCQAVVGDLSEYEFAQRPGSAGASAAAGTEEQSGAAGAAAPGGSAGADGSDPLASSGAGAGGVVPALVCREGARQCLGDAVQTCVGDAWGAPVACAAPTPACNGGVCGELRLSGGLVSVGGNLVTANYRLVEHGFEALPTVCGDVNRERVCVTGGLRP